MGSHLSSELVQKLKAQLLEKKSDLEDELKLLGSEDSFLDPDRTVGNSEEADEASEGASHLENELKQNTAKETLGLVEKALAKIENNTYGSCEVDGEDIKEERLIAMPEAPTCLKHSDSAIDSA